MSVGSAKHGFIYTLTKFISYWILRLFFSLRVYGLENYPVRGPFIIASNHQSNMDPVLLGAICPKYVHFMAKKELFRSKIGGWYMRALNAFPVDRARGDLSAIKTSLGLLKSSQAVVMFPEGTRSRDGRLGKAHAGIGMLVARAGVPVVPCYISGSFEAMPKDGRGVRRTPIHIFFGAPLKIEHAGETKQDYRLIGEQIMTAIAALVPPESGDKQ